LTASDGPSFRTALREVLAHLSPARRRQFAAVLALMLLGALAEVALVGSVVPFLAMLGGEPGTASLGPIGRLVDNRSLASVALAFIAAVLAAGAIRLLLSWANQRFVTGVGHDLAVESQRRILLQPYSFHIEQSSSAVIASLEKVRLLVFGVLLQAMQAAVALVIGLCIMALLISMDAAAALAAFSALALLYLLVSRLTARRLRRSSAVLGTAYDRRIKIIQESLGGIRDLIIDQTQVLSIDQFRRADSSYARSQASAMFIAGAPRFVIEAAALAFIAGLAMVLGGRGSGFGQALPVLGAIALGGLRLLPLLQQAYAGWATMAANRSVIGQVLDLLRLPVPDEEPIGSPLPFTRAVELDAVSFSYPARSEPAVDSVSQSIARGEHLAVAGKTGSGKSTLADLLMGLLDPTTGCIQIDGEPLTPANRRRWQANIAHVPQSIFLADASIARNIALSVHEDSIDAERVRRSAELAMLADFIATLPDGYETIVGERGVRLSGGQRQRLGIARALYKQAPFLILDEATNALDEETEGQLLANLFADKSRTILLITHRKSAAARCDRVLLMDGGCIAGV
jgi:ABC-type multidrug transport system fused ATPase/permease subunit